MLQQTTGLQEAGHGMILDIPVAAINLLRAGDDRSFRLGRTGLDVNDGTHSTNLNMYLRN
jgi:hypothetical protein